MPFHMHTVHSKDGHLHLGQSDVILKYGVITHGKKWAYLAYLHAQSEENVFKPGF